MKEAACIVCGKIVTKADQEEHLRSQHLGPHYFWFDGLRFKSDKPSATIAELKAMTGLGIAYQTFLEVIGDGPDRGVGDGEAVDLTHEPHFYAIPPATMFGCGSKP